jgi:hypothetical protein
MNIDVNHIVRSAAIVLVGAPLALSTSNLLNTTSTAAQQATQITQAQSVKTEYGDKLAKACYGYALSKVDSKLERESKNTIDEVFGGEVDYKTACNAFVF